MHKEHGMEHLSVRDTYCVRRSLKEMISAGHLVPIGISSRECGTSISQSPSRVVCLDQYPDPFFYRSSVDLGKRRYGHSSSCG